jgi:transposase
LPRVGLKLDQKEYEVVVEKRRVAKKYKDMKASARLRALLLVNEGKSLEETAQILEVARSTVQNWIARYRSRGVTALLFEGPHLGKMPRLSLDQKRQLAELIRKGPEAAGLDTGVWTAPIVADLVKRRFQVSYSYSQIRRILHELGFSLQYPRQILSKADKKRQATWKDEELPAIKKKSKRKRQY